MTVKSNKLVAKWFLVGAVIGYSACVSDMPILVKALTAASRFGWELALLVCFAIALSFLAFLFSRGVSAARTQLSRVRPKLLQAALVFLGVTSSSAGYWFFTGSKGALRLALSALPFGLLLLFCWWGLGIFEDELLKRFQESERSTRGE